MTILEVIPTPRHRSLYPGELLIGLGKMIVPPGGPDLNKPAGVTIRLKHADCNAGTWIVPAAGPCRLIAKQKTPVMLRVGTLARAGRVELASQAGVAGYTGAALARELTAHARSLVALTRPQQVWADRTVRFADPGGYNALISGLSARFLGVSKDEALRELLADVHENWDVQMGWYEANGPSEPGETRAGYEAEVAAFQALTSRWLRAIRTEMAFA